MIIWKVDKSYLGDSDEPIYTVVPKDLKDHLYCCKRWYGIKGLKWCYLFLEQAKKKARKLNELLSDGKIK